MEPSASAEETAASTARTMTYRYRYFWLAMAAGALGLGALAFAVTDLLFVDDLRSVWGASDPAGFLLQALGFLFVALALWRRRSTMRRWLLVGCLLMVGSYLAFLLEDAWSAVLVTREAPFSMDAAQYTLIAVSNFVIALAFVLGALAFAGVSPGSGIIHTRHSQTLMGWAGLTLSVGYLLLAAATILRTVTIVGMDSFYAQGLYARASGFRGGDYVARALCLVVGAMALFRAVRFEGSGVPHMRVRRDRELRIAAILLGASGLLRVVYVALSIRYYSPLVPMFPQELETVVAITWSGLAQGLRLVICAGCLCFALRPSPTLAGTPQGAP